MEGSVELKGIGKKYALNKALERDIAGYLDELWALRDISFNVDKGEILGIIGRNGAGKTTLLNIIANTVTPTEGTINVSGKTIGLFNLGIGFQEELTGRENIFLNGAILGASRQELKERLDAIIAFSELGNFINLPLGAYSQGMRLRLGFSIAVNLNFDILVIDEILAVGDTQFQNKCFKRLTDFKHMGKTMVITNQNPDLIERLCDRTLILDHGKLLFEGSSQEASDRYYSLLNTENFSVGPKDQTNGILIRDTKKWTDDKSIWGASLGTKEAIINKVEFINKYGFRSQKIKTGDPLKVKVRFMVKNTIKDPHFGIALFRDDGVYCYGPNTLFDGIRILELRPGNHQFTLKYNKLLLAPGKYRASVVIWDKKEALAFDYHNGFYRLDIKGPCNGSAQLINLPFKRTPLLRSRKPYSISLDSIKDSWGKIADAKDVNVESFKLLDKFHRQKDTFFTNELAEVAIKIKSNFDSAKKFCLWVGIYRSDGIYCQGIKQVISLNESSFAIIFPKLSILPGSYRISLGIWDTSVNQFIMLHHGVYPFQMVFDRLDHGTIFLEHKWFLSK